MGTTVISGGTDGLGRALAAHQLRAGETVVVIGRDAGKFRTLAAIAPGRAHFVQADLRLVQENDRVATHIAERHPRIDTLFLAAAHVVRGRNLTTEGIEHNLALYALSRHVLADALLPQLSAATRPVIINTAVPGAPRTAIRWDDLTLAGAYSWRTANHQSRRANELSGLALTKAEPRLKYVLYNPLFVRSSLSGDLSPAHRALTRVLFRLAPTPEQALTPILALLTDPPAGRLSAYTKKKRLPLEITPEDHAEALRWTELTTRLRAGL
ncbi:SDR family NAD(P)-dependent oxidoreductase [Crossiella cryophila]|uniref:NAD(P)-dependent dehydrogenase (Short-subunit alcohol dehydrogenase family) n=1 Tax=Crossiella cryophila TaxID=43355 RepID=A0A7W7FU51_9PSEU|nr:SDR family NAD(P)-dependent oxidoreductase [Crossiella cryophila]MBB4677720.1 NAD(P)-dependent dehydrogenase (short-subunit alcohol dehydrogenase family) [Crossiella cryophila]